MMQSGVKTDGVAANYSNFQLTILVALRMLIGWHLFYEGLTKLLNP